MDIAKFEELCDFFSANGYVLLKVMGGEPTLHPQFKEMIEIAQSRFSQVNLFTNGISNALLDFTPRDTDNVIYNFKFCRVLNPEKLLLNRPGKRSLEIQVAINMDSDRLLNDILRVSNFSNRKLNLFLTLDCKANIFKEGENVVPIYEKIWKTCTEMGLEIGQDHIAPLCYVSGSKIPIPQSGAKCHVDCAGLIDASYNIRFCNQYSDCLANVFSNNGRLITIQEYEALLSQKFFQIQNLTKSKGCISCPMYKVYCNGGCFAAKDNITPNGINNRKSI